MRPSDMSRFALLALLAFACKGGYTPPPEDKQAPAVEPPQSVTFRAAGPAGEARAAIASFPRVDWPCAVRFKNFDGEPITRRIVYDRTSCIVPAVLMDDTLGGCPARLMDAPIKYDAEGRLVAGNMQEYAWGKAGPTTRDVMGEPRWRFGMLGGDVATGSDTSVDEIARLDVGGRVTSVDQVKQANVIASSAGVFITPVSGMELVWTTRLVYEGTRIVRVKHHGEHAGDSETEVLHDCSSLPPEGSAR